MARYVHVLFQGGGGVGGAGRVKAAKNCQRVAHLFHLPTYNTYVEQSGDEKAWLRQQEERLGRFVCEHSNRVRVPTDTGVTTYIGSLAF